MNQAIGAWSSHGGFVFCSGERTDAVWFDGLPARKRGRRPGRKPGDRDGCAASGMALEIGNNRQRHAALATMLHMVLKMLMFAAANTRFRAQRASSSEGRTWAARRRSRPVPARIGGSPPAYAPRAARSRVRGGSHAARCSAKFILCYNVRLLLTH